MVAGAAALQLGTSIRRTWIGTLSDGLIIEMVLAALGVVAAVLLRDAPVLLPVLALPILILHRALQELVRLRTDTHAAPAELVEVIALRDPYTAGHSRRVADLPAASRSRWGSPTRRPTWSRAPARSTTWGR